MSSFGSAVICEHFSGLGDDSHTMNMPFLIWIGCSNKEMHSQMHRFVHSFHRWSCLPAASENAPFHIIWMLGRGIGKCVRFFRMWGTENSENESQENETSWWTEVLWKYDGFLSNINLTNWKFVGNTNPNPSQLQEPLIWTLFRLMPPLLFLPPELCHFAWKNFLELSLKIHVELRRNCFAWAPAQ